MVAVRSSLRNECVVKPTAVRGFKLVVVVVVVNSKKECVDPSVSGSGKPV